MSLGKKNRDVKFVIYQSLYIFVVCVVAIKGANLDLVQVLEDDGQPKVIMTPEQMDSIQQLLKTSVIVDTNHFIVVPKELLKENKKLQEIVKNMPERVDLSLYVRKEDIPVIEEKEQSVEKEEIVLGELSLYQYHWNTINNKGDASIVVAGVSIPPHTSKNVLINGESSIVISSGSISKTIGVQENRKPVINVQQMASMSGDEVKLSKLQQTVGYRVTVTDDFADQLVVKVTGSVISDIKKQSDKEIVIDIRLNAFPTKMSFDNFVDGLKDSRDYYQSGFDVTVTDKLAPHIVGRRGIFRFTEW